MKQIRKFLEGTKARLTTIFIGLLRYAYAPVSLRQFNVLALFAFACSYVLTFLMTPEAWELRLFFDVCIGFVLGNVLALAKRHMAKLEFRPIDILLYAEQSFRMLSSVFRVFIDFMRGTGRFWRSLLILAGVQLFALGWILVHIKDNVIPMQTKNAILDTAKWMLNSELSLSEYVITLLFAFAMVVVVRRTYTVDHMALDAVVDGLKAANVPVPYKHEGAYCKLDADTLLNRLANKEIQLTVPR